MRYLKSVVLGMGFAALLMSCAPESDKPSTDHVIEPDSNGELVLTSRPEGAEPVLAPEAVGDKAGCTHIRFCSTPGRGNTITCDTNDSPCSNGARYNECDSDARAVCGRINPMLYDPPIPCPIPGVC